MYLGQLLNWSESMSIFSHDINMSSGCMWMLDNYLEFMTQELFVVFYSML